MLKCIFRIYIDEVKLLDVRPGTGGMWEFGGFDKQMPSDRNPWVGGGNLAPFDREVKIQFLLHP